MLDVHRLRLLRELHRRGTLAAVAAALGYSPSAVSQQLSQLEAEAGVPLLEKVGRGVALTAAARVLVGHADAVLAQLERAEADLAALHDDVTGTLRVASFQSVLFVLVPAALTRLARSHPALRVEIGQHEPGPAFSLLAAHDVDLVLGEEYPGYPQPRAADADDEDLVLDELRLAVPREGPWSGARSLADVDGAPWVVEPRGTEPGAWILAECRRAGFEPDVRISSPDVLLHVRLVETGHAVALLPDLAWAGRRPALRLVDLPARPARRLFTRVRRGAAERPAVQAFRQALREAAAGVAAGPAAGSATPGRTARGPR
ncbi:LysR family transcriptional regulator [Kineococcus radiotolerans]|uniref:LysR family transcriptional regulator n=1 Tax=Kineococcus radiotolerans TaxID=131568 RepID=UPI0035D4A9B3